MPLAPDLGLVITPRQQTNRRITAAAFNQTAVYNSREFVAHHPIGLADQSLRFALREDIQRQRWILPIIREGTTV